MNSRQTNLAVALAVVTGIFGIQSASGFYDPNLGRWINRDPIGEQASINLYMYVENTPVCNVDALGLDILPRNSDPDPFCADRCDKQLADCLNKRTLICSLGGAGVGGAAQLANKTATAPGKGGLFGGPPSGDYTSYTRKWFGRGAGRSIGRVPVPAAAVLSAAAADLVGLASCSAQYGSCLDRCPRAPDHPPFPINKYANAPPALGIIR